MQKILVFLLVTLVYSSFAFGQEEDNSPIIEFVYADLFHINDVIILSEKDGALILGDVSDSAYYCSPATKYICVFHEYFKFSVPISNLNTQVEWDYRGVNFINEGKRKVQILGREMELYKIKSVVNDIEGTYLFSDTEGLMLFSFTSKTELVSKNYIIVSKSGFGVKNIELRVDQP